jgi:hypothetical protein
MGVTVSVNNLSVVHKDSAGISISFPDVCITPAFPSPVPVPYPNIAQSIDTDKGSKSVKCDGNPVCVNDSNFSISTGDEAGVNNGVASGKIKGIAEFMNYSFDVKFEGKNVARAFDLMVHNDKNTAPVPVLQIVIIVINVDQEISEKKFKCDWMDCQGDHDEDINSTYRNPEGSVTRGNASSGEQYGKEWVNEKLEPWELMGNGKNPHSTRKDFESDFDKKDSPDNKKVIKKACTKYAYPKYVTEKHHLISVHLFEDFERLSNNAKLIGYNVNDKENGACLPRFRVDIVQHNLPKHHGRHPKHTYDNRVINLLKSQDFKCKKYCRQKKQWVLKAKLNRISKRILDNLCNWEDGWQLGNKSLEEKKWAYDRLK